MEAGDNGGIADGGVDGQPSINCLLHNSRWDLHPCWRGWGRRLTLEAA
jgi:hypothetical protein